MKVEHHIITTRTKGRGLYDITREVADAVLRTKVDNGLCTVFIEHTSASLVVQENADPSVRRDLERWIEGEFRGTFVDVEVANHAISELVASEICAEVGVTT